MDNEFIKFKELIKKEYPNILIKGIPEEEDFNIYYYLEDFDINNLEFHRKFGACLRKSFSKNKLSSIGTEFLYESELKDFFPELFDIKIEKDLDIRKKVVNLKSLDFLFFNKKKINSFDVTDSVLNLEGTYYLQAV
jgi:hypothetical protein